MQPRIEATKFGSITIHGERIDNDVIIKLDGTVKNREEELSKSIYDTSHLISLAEAQYVFEEGAKLLIIGTGQFDSVHLDEEAQRFFAEEGCRVQLLPTPKAIQSWNEAEGKAIALFHVTC